MKKVFLTVILAFAGLASQAQDKGMKFGVKLGPNFSTLTGDADDASVRVGFHGGVFAEFMITDAIGIQPEVLFSMQGANSDYEAYFGNIFDDVEGWDKIKLNYINVPIMVNYHFAAVKGLSAGIGPQVGFLMSAKEEGTGYDAESGNYYNYDTDVKDYYKSIDVAICAGAQYEFSFGLIASVRGNLGLLNIADYPGSGSYKLHNNVIQISAAYSFL
ncbi:porin family protein [Flavobacterium silvaticum]|uniref:PorT family protein n=1 Tax=Flavobacterium silvaticum TaxID=1852020 RepID=A0A972FVT2_9FLAO|nr:porin family protein [Flavobacterium silvaticum]NMH28535.1 PorT family protein [Flavobacterium silvaticum]